jgi:hypothetical protein
MGIEKDAWRRNVNTTNNPVFDTCSCFLPNLRMCLRDCVAASMVSSLHSSLLNLASLRRRRVALHTKKAQQDFNVLERIRSLKSGPVVHILKSTQHRHMRFTDVYCISNYFSHASKHEATKYHSSGLYKASAGCVSLFFITSFQDSKPSKKNAIILCVCVPLSQNIGTMSYVLPDKQ